jgi:hypothetical protein
MQAGLSSNAQRLDLTHGQTVHTLIDLILFDVRRRLLVKEKQQGKILSESDDREW